MKQIIQIALTTIFAVLILASIALGQEFSFNESGSEADTAELKADEEMMELMYKYDLPLEGEIEETSYERLPSEVKNYLMNSQFSEWTVAQAFKVAEPENDSLAFVIFVEQEGYLEQLTITPNGKLVEN